jgi:hypothetical protein
VQGEYKIEWIPKDEREGRSNKIVSRNGAISLDERSKTGGCIIVPDHQTNPAFDNVGWRADRR